MIVWSLTSAFLTFEEVLCLALCSKALQKAEEQLFEYFFFTARKNIDEHWMNLFMSNSEIHRHHAQDVLDSFQNCVLNNKKSDYSFKTLSLFHRLNFVYYPTPEVAKLCQTTCHKFGLLKSRPKMLVEVQKVLNLHGRRRGDYYSMKNVLQNKLGAMESQCKSLQHLSNEMALITRNIKKATEQKDVHWEHRWLRIKRPHAELCNKFEELQRIRQQVTKTAKQAEKKRKLANNVNAKVKRMKFFMDQQRSLESMFLKSIR
jgi:hypothetical protein